MSTDATRRTNFPIAEKYVAESAANARSWPPVNVTNSLGAGAASYSRLPNSNAITPSSLACMNSLGIAIESIRSTDANRSAARSRIGIQGYRDAPTSGIEVNAPSRIRPAASTFAARCVATPDPSEWP